MKKNILFFGLGSIGERHAKLLTNHFDVELSAYRTGKGINSLGIKEFRNLEEAFDSKPDAVFIANPTNLHVETAISCAERSIDLFIEKPLSNSLEGIDKLIDLINKNKLITHVAFCLRYHPVIKYLKETLKEEEIFYARTICSSYFPSWRPGQDYRKSYSADRSRGGGVTNELIHELDYNEYLFGKIDQLKGSAGHVSSLEISADDYGEFQLDHETGIQTHISLDFFSHLRERALRIYTSKKVVLADIINQIIRTYKKHELVEEIKLPNENMYLKQLISFMKAIEDRKTEDLCTVQESRNLVEKISKFN